MPSTDQSPAISCSKNNLILNHFKIESFVEELHFVFVYVYNGPILPFGA